MALDPDLIVASAPTTTLLTTQLLSTTGTNRDTLLDHLPARHVMMADLDKFSRQLAGFRASDEARESLVSVHFPLASRVNQDKDVAC